VNGLEGAKRSIDHPTEAQLEEAKRAHQQSLEEEEARQQRVFEETRKAEGRTSSREPLDEASLLGKTKAKFEHLVHHHDDQETTTEKRQ